MRPEHKHYDEIERLFNERIKNGDAILFDPTLFDKEMTRLWEAYDVPYQTLLSFFRNLYVLHVKKRAPVVQRNIANLVEDYSKGTSLVDIAKKFNFPPFLLARYMVAELTLLPKKSLADAMRDPSKYLGSRDVLSSQYRVSEMSWSGMEAFNTRIEMETIKAIQTDPLYGPLHDKERYLVGVEHEVLLEYCLRKLNIPFETEADLRDRGTSKTPDVLLGTPLGIEVPTIDGSSVEWQMICWIDSKALFGDVATHKTSVLPQAESYVHRFGPGLVVYWFGHAPLERISESQPDVIVWGWELPSRFMLPTGNIINSSF